MMESEHQRPKIEEETTNELHFPRVLGTWVRDCVALVYEDGLLTGEVLYVQDVGGSDWHVSIELAHGTEWEAEAWSGEENADETIATGEFVEVVNDALEAMATEAVPTIED
ncbi:MULTISPECIES: hypothetical protein [Haloferax]|uniref:Uncharacterized protein n=1 Tax=Haloferax marinum TaxID=2666143 RepID=A0A6A8G6X5_9EURY|nr:MULTISPECIES: hypothetical protein [Haloferax]KAB1197737.1 hypothetical protein Hfx1150_09460 [Haloferax sp. CBA1150]MRW96791.1 hypothetical protein [Haloferax marinum]